MAGLQLPNPPPSSPAVRNVMRANRARDTGPGATPTRGAPRSWPGRLSAQLEEGAWPAGHRVSRAARSRSSSTGATGTTARAATRTCRSRTPNSGRGSSSSTASETPGSARTSRRSAGSYVEAWECDVRDRLDNRRYRGLGGVNASCSSRTRSRYDWLSQNAFLITSKPPGAESRSRRVASLRPNMDVSSSPRRFGRFRACPVSISDRKRSHSLPIPAELALGRAPEERPPRVDSVDVAPPPTMDRNDRAAG